MSIEHKDFIGFYRNVFPDGYCQHMIKEFDIFESRSVGTNRQESDGVERHIKNDYQIFRDVNLDLRPHNLELFDNKRTGDIFFDGLQKCFDDYSNIYSTLKNDKIRAATMKMQRTTTGGGYHVWHHETGNGVSGNRVITYMLYLNTLPDTSNGETEFLYQGLRIRPEENLMLFWPAGYTHPHRGNPVYGSINKYIITGWFYYD